MTKENRYWLDVYTRFKDDNLKKDFYEDFNEEELKFLSECKFKELVR